MTSKIAFKHYRGAKWLNMFGGKWNVAGNSYQKSLQVFEIYSKEFFHKKTNRWLNYLPTWDGAFGMIGMQKG